MHDRRHDTADHELLSPVEWTLVMEAQIEPRMALLEVDDIRLKRANLPHQAGGHRQFARRLT